MAMRRTLRLLTLMAVLFLLALFPAQAQDSFQDVIEMSVSPGFGSFFRPNEWTPIRIQVKNNGGNITGRLVIRPETSGTVVTNPYSTPIDLPSGAEKSATLNIKARSFPDQIRVELIDDEGFIQSTVETTLNDVQAQDQLYAVVAGANSRPVSLVGVHIGGYQAEQAIWAVTDIPDNALSLESLDAILLLNIDSEALSSAQRTAIQLWVRDGGHLIVIGGPNWQATASAFRDLLPMTPDDSQSVDDLTTLARYGGDYQSTLEERTVIATGTVKEGAQILVESDGIPLLVRGTHGNGVIDYLVADPSLEPLSSWDDLSGLWLSLLSSRDPLPIWSEGFTRPQWGADAIANLPGVDLLPPLQTLCLYLFVYILLIGPINYFILSRLNRNGWGWVTIPLVIAIFTGVAWTVGFSLRGTEIIVSRATVVQTWSDSDTAKVDQFVGLLSPRRANYSLSVPEGYFLAVSEGAAQAGLFTTNNVQSSTEIRQATPASADDFVVDGGIFANFTVSGNVPKPDIAGTLSLSYDITENGFLTGGFQGVIRNDSEIPLRDAVILAHESVYRLEGEFAPGDIVTIDRADLTMDMGDFPAQPNPLEYHLSVLTTGLSPFDRVGNNVPTIGELQGDKYQRARAFIDAESITEKQSAREQAFLASFLIDQFDTTARGTKAYLLGWHDSWARDLEVEGASWSNVDTTLYIIELDIEVVLPDPTETVTLSTDQFVWMTTDRVGLTEGGTDNLTLYETQRVDFRFTPLAPLYLDEVDQLKVELDRGGGYAQSLTFELYNWESGEYELYTSRQGDILTFDDPARLLGPNNAVAIRTQYEQGIGTARVRKIRVQQTGRFT